MLKANAMDIGPIRPRYIVTITINLPNVLSDGVKFLDKPTVANADVVSNRISRNSPPSTTESNIVERNHTDALTKITASAFLI